MEKNDRPSCFTAVIDLSLKDKLASDLESQGFVLSPAPYAFFSAKKSGISCNLYLSGKLTVQGKAKEEFIEFYLEPEILHNLSYTHSLSTGPSPFETFSRIGLDEAGKGDFFGPLCAAGIFVPEAEFDNLRKMGVKDSKLLSDEVILKTADRLKKTFPHKILILFPETYNRLYGKFHNLNRLLGWAHVTVLEELSTRTGCKRAILDQFALPELMNSFVRQKKLDVDLTQKVRAEQDPVVAAASILARAAFVEGIKKLGDEIGCELPKGASAKVVETGKHLLRLRGPDIFPKIAKTHFKTFKDLSPSI